MRRLAVLAATLSILAAACGGAAPTAATSAPTTVSTIVPSQTPADVAMACCKKIVAAYSNISADDWVMWYAFEKGIFKQRGLEVDMQSISGGAQTSAALLANQIHVGQFGGSEALSGNAGGANLVIVGNMAPVYPYLLYAQKQYKTVADLKGKKIGVSNKGGSSDIATRAALKAAGFDPDKDFQIVAVGSHANRTAALLNGSIDAGVDDPPEDQELVKAGLSVVLDLAAQKLPAANTGIIVQRSYLDANKDVIQAYVDATVIARARMAKDKDGAIAVLQKYFKITETESPTHAYNFFIAGASPVTPLYPFPAVEQFKDAVAILGLDNPKIKDVDLTRLIDTSFVKSAQDRKLSN
jgi:ABC-type nitrate/sulfonate/bicarbonate transport system substrate-binding protein